MAFAGLANAFVVSLLFLSSIAAVHGDVEVTITLPPVLPQIELPVIFKTSALPLPPVNLPVPPVHPPVAVPPVLPPVTPPVAEPPVKPPTHRRVKPSVVQGVVYCKSCKYRGIDTLIKASPLSGAVVKLVCKNTKTVENAKTDKNGYFFFMPKNLTRAGSRTCKVFLVSSPLRTCNAPTNLRGGVTGSPLIPAPAVKPPKKKQKLPFIYNVGPFAFEPSKKLPCKY